MTEPRKVSRAQLERYQDYKEVFGSDAGKRVLKDLEGDFRDGCWAPGRDLYEILFRAFCRDLLDYIKRMLEMAEGPLEIEED